MKISEYTEQKTQFLKSDDLALGSVWHITEEGEMMIDGFGKEKLHLPLACKDEVRLFSCNKTNARTIETALGDDTKAWVKKKLKIGIYKTKIDGLMRDVLNVEQIVE